MNVSRVRKLPLRLQVGLRHFRQGGEIKQDAMLFFLDPYASEIHTDLPDVRFSTYLLQFSAEKNLENCAAPSCSFRYTHQDGQPKVVSAPGSSAITLEYPVYLFVFLPVSGFGEGAVSPG